MHTLNPLGLMRTLVLGLWFGFDVGTWIVRQRFASGDNFRLSVTHSAAYPSLT